MTFWLIIIGVFVVAGLLAYFTTPRSGNWRGPG